MSESRLLKHIAKGTAVSDNLTFTPVFVSDSKGNYLKYCATDNKIQWLYKGGTNSRDIFNWLEKNVRKLTKKYGRIRIYVWIGTCDLTSKSGRYISLKPDSALTELKHNLQHIKDTYISDRVCLTFLQVPYYSISIWNEKKGHKEPELFKCDDNKLNELIDSVNVFIDKLNTEINSYTPKFNQDLLRSRKRRNSKSRYSLNFNLLPDGIHPGKNLSKAWLTSLIKNINSECL